MVKPKAKVLLGDIGFIGPNQLPWKNPRSLGNIAAKCLVLYLHESGPRVPEALHAAVVAHLVRPVVGQSGHAGPRILRRGPGHSKDLKTEIVH